MLVLSRKLNEKIVIDGGIVISVVKIDRNQIRLGIEAPRKFASFAKRSPPRRGEPMLAKWLPRDFRKAPERAVESRCQDWRKVQEKIDIGWIMARQPRAGRLFWLGSALVQP